SLPFDYLSLTFFACPSASKSHPCPGGQSRGTATVLAPPTSRGRTRGTCSRRCARWTPTSRSVTANAPASNGTFQRGSGGFRRVAKENGAHGSYRSHRSYDNGRAGAQYFSDAKHDHSRFQVSRRR